MPALDREELTEACRALFSLAGENLILPPLIREAGDANSTSGYTYYCAAGQRCVRVDVEFDQQYVNENKFPLQRLPLLISCFVCDQDYQVLPTPFDESERQALIGSFFLGAQAPITVEVSDGGREFKISVQLSPTFFAEWREPTPEAEGTTAESLCRRVGACLYEKSQALFSSRETGIAVWSLRAAQELLGAPKLTPEALWPFISFGLVAAASAPPAAPPAAPQAPASMSVPAPASAPLPVAAASSPIETRLAKCGASMVPTEEPAFPTRAQMMGREWRKPLSWAAAAALAASVLALLQPAALPRWATAREPAVQATAPAAPAVAGRAADVEADRPGEQLRFLAALPDPAAPAAPLAPPSGDPALGAAADLTSGESWPSIARPPKLNTGAHGRTSVTKKPTSALHATPKSAPSAGTAAKTAGASHVMRKGRRGGPMQSVGRAMDHMATSLIKGIQAIPGKIVKIAE